MMKPVWILPLLGFLSGALLGALALGDRAAPERRVDQAPAADLSAPTGQASAFGVGGVPPVPVGTPTTGAMVESPAPLPVGPPVDPRLESALTAWRAAEARIADLQARLANLERAMAERDQAVQPDRPKGPSTPDERRDALVSAGVDRGLADDILGRESRLELDRLNLRDLAVREGWIGSDRYRDELNALAGEERSVRDEIGDTAWDRYLYDTGADNRVAVSAVIPGSVAEAAGLQPGDLVESYAGERLFGFAELRDATTQGESGELVPIRVKRGGAVVEAWVPRGPLGVRMEMTRADPVP